MLLRVLLYASRMVANTSDDVLNVRSLQKLTNAPRTSVIVAVWSSNTAVQRKVLRGRCVSSILARVLGYLLGGYLPGGHLPIRIFARLILIFCFHYIALLVLAFLFTLFLFLFNISTLKKGYKSLRTLLHSRNLT